MRKSTPESKPNSSGGLRSKSLMESTLGLLRVRIIRGVNLAVRDVRSSDPYVVLKIGKQRLKTKFIRRDVNPEWNEDLTLSITDPNLPIKLTVYDHDTFTKDDKMGNCEFSIKTFVDALKQNMEGVANGTVIATVYPSKENCLADDSCVSWVSGRVVQDMCLRLQNVECGEVEIQLQWIDLPGCKGV